MSISGVPDETKYEYVDRILMKYGHEHSILDCSELDGFLTAIVSGLDTIMPSEWLQELWGGKDKDPEWESEEEFTTFFNTAIQMMNFNAHMLMEDPDNYCALFKEREVDGKRVEIVDEWCYGFMRGVSMRKSWQLMPPEMQAHLDIIALHGLPQNFEKRRAMSEEEFVASTQKIEPAVRALHAYWLEKRKISMAGNHHPKSISHEGPKVGRNDPCPCGSGKKFKKCCLH